MRVIIINRTKAVEFVSLLITIGLNAQIVTLETSKSASTMVSTGEGDLR